MQPTSAQEVLNSLLALNRPTAPYVIRPAIPGEEEGADLVAEWKIVDANWYQIFEKAGLKKVFKILIKLHPENNTVGTVDKEYSVSWNAGVPSLSANASFFRGQKMEFSFSFMGGFVYNEEAGPGVAYQYKFNTDEIEQPMQNAIAANGWTHQPVAFGQL